MGELKPLKGRRVNSQHNITPHSPVHNFSTAQINGFRNSILKWYDAHRRVLPWRAPPGRKADPYHVWLSEIMLQQTVVAAVMPYFNRFVERWPTVGALAAAPVEDIMAAWAGLGYYSRARNLHKCAQTVAGDFKGRFPPDQATLKTLPGVGEYTSAAITAIAFDRPATVIDGNVDRVMARYCAVEEPFPAGKKTVRLYAEIFSEGRADRPGDFAQALMDIGATVCIPKAPRCGACPVAKTCRGRIAGIAQDLPAKSPRKDKPHKTGRVYWIEDGKGNVLLERRAEDGMMGGMLALPVSDWVLHGENVAHPALPAAVSHIRLVKSIVVKHSFTHFDLTLHGYTARADRPVRGGRFQWVAAADAAKAGLPSLFSKAAKLFYSRQSI